VVDLPHFSLWKGVFFNISSADDNSYNAVNRSPEPC